MGDEVQNGKGAAAGWFLRKFFSSPATWLGLAAAFGAGNAALGVDVPMGGAIGGGVMIGFAVGMITFAIIHGIKAAHQKALESGTDEGSAIDSNEQAVLEVLRNSGQSKDADLLQKMLGDRDAILKRCRSGKADRADAAHTLELASAIVKESCRQAEELQDMVRRVEDPVLTSPDGAAEKIEGIRADLQHAYQVIADARSRLRRGEKMNEADFLDDAESLASLNLSALSSQLEEETAVSKRIEERLRPDFKSGIVMEDPVEPDGEAMRESE